MVQGLEGPHFVEQRPGRHHGHHARMVTFMLLAQPHQHHVPPPPPPRARLTLPARGPCVAVHAEALPTDRVTVSPAPAGAVQDTAWPEEAPPAACGWGGGGGRDRPECHSGPPGAGTTGLRTPPGSRRRPQALVLPCMNPHMGKHWALGTGPESLPHVPTSSQAGEGELTVREAP